MDSGSRTRTNTKFLAKSAFKPDAGLLSALKSMKQNPKFSRLLGFSMNCMAPMLVLPNPRHRDNVNYVISQGGHVNIVQAIRDHIADDNILFNAVGLLTKMIGRDKFKDEEIARLVIDQGGIQALVDAMNHPTEKSKHTIKAMIDLLDLLGVNPNLAGKMIDQGVLEATVNTMQKSRLNETSVKNGLEALQKLTSHAQAKKALITRNIVPQIVSLLEKKSQSAVVVTAGLKLIETISRSAEGVEYLKKDGMGMQAIVSLMEKHPTEKAVLNVGANVLRKVATINDLRQAMDSLKNAGGDPKYTSVNAALLSQLVLVDEMMEDVIKHGAVTDMIAIIKQNVSGRVINNKDRVNLIKHCAVAIGRIAEIDERQVKEVIDKGGLETLHQALEIIDPEVFESCVGTLQKISKYEGVLPKIASIGCVKRVLSQVPNFLKEERICENTIGFLGTVANDEALIEQIVESKGIESIVQMMKAHPDNKKIIEQGTKTLGLLMVNEENAKKLIDNGVVEFLVDVTKKHPNWRKFALYSVNLMDVLTMIDSVVPELKKAQGVQAIVSIMNGKSYDISQYAHLKEGAEAHGTAGAAAAGGAEAQEEEREVKQSDDVLNPRQEVELNELAIEVLGKLVTPEEVKSYKSGLEASIAQLEKSQDIKNVCELEAKIATLGSISLIPTLGERVLKDDVINPVLEFAKKVHSLPDFEGKSGLVATTVGFFNNISYLNNREATKPVYQQKKVGEHFLNFVNEILDKNQEPVGVIQGLKSLKNVLSQKVGEASGAKAGPKRMSLLDVNTNKDAEKTIEKMIEGVISNMRKYPENEEIQLNGIDVFNTMSQISPQMNSAIVKLGGSRYIISKLEDELTPRKVGLASLKLLKNIGSSSKDAVILMNNQKAAPAIMSFLSNNRNDNELSEAAAPLLKQLASVENSELTRDLENDISELVKTISPEQADDATGRQNIVESLELLGNFALLEKSIDPIIKKGTVGNIIKLFSKELKNDEGKLAEKGELALHERILTACLNNINRLLSNPQAIKSNIHKEILSQGLVDNVVSIIKTKQNFPALMKYALITANNLLNNDKTKEEVVKKAVAGGIIENLTDCLERFKEEPEITQAANKLIFGLTKASAKVAEKLTEKNFVKNLIRETKAALREGGDDNEAVASTKQNLECLAVLADVGQTAEKIAAEGGVDFAVSILKRENAGTERGADEEAMYALNLQTVEQQEEKQGNVMKSGESVPVVEKSVSLNALELLEKMIKNPEKAEKYLTEEGVREILKSLENNAADREATLTTLKLLNTACQNQVVAKLVEKNKGVDSIFTALNQHPTDKAIIAYAGETLQILGAEALARDLKPQFSELESAFNTKVEETVDGMRKANVYLANLLTVPQPDDDEAALKENQPVIHALEKTLSQTTSSTPPEFLASQLLLTSRLCNQGDATKKALRESGVPQILLKKVVSDGELMNPDNGKIPEFAIEALKEMLGGSEDMLRMLDEKGRDVIIPAEKDNNGKLSEIVLKNDGEVLEELLEIAEIKPVNGDKPFSLQTVESTVELLSRLALNDPEVASTLAAKGGVQRLKELYEDLSRLHTEKVGAPVAKIGKLIGALSKAPVGYQKIAADDRLIPGIVETLNSLPINQDLAANRQNLQTLKEGLKCIETISDNKFDKSKLIEHKVPECVIDVLRRLNQIPSTTFKESEGLTEALEQSMSTLKALEKDPALARVISKNDGAEVISNTLHKLAQIHADEPGLSDPNLKPDPTTEIIGSADINDRAVESSLAAAETLSVNPKHAEKMFLLKPGSLLGSDIKELIRAKATNPVVVTKALKTVENCLKTYTPEEVKSNISQLKPIEEMAKLAAAHFPNLIAVKTMSQNISAVASGKKLEDEAKAEELKKLENTINLMQIEAKAVEAQVIEAKAIEEKQEAQAATLVKQTAEVVVPKEEEKPLAPITTNSADLLNKLDFVADSLENFARNPSSAQEAQILQLLAAVCGMANSPEMALKMHNMGIVDALVSLLNSPNVSEAVKAQALEALSKLTQDEKVVEKFEGDDKLSKSVVNALFNAKKPLSQLQKGLVKKALEAAGNLANNQGTLDQFISEGGIKAIIELMKNNKDSPDILTPAAEALAKLTVDDDVVSEIFELGGLELIAELYGKYVSLLEFLRAFALLVSKLARNEAAKNGLGDKKIPAFIIDGVGHFPATSR